MLSTKLLLAASVVIGFGITANAQIRSYVGEWTFPGDSETEIKKVKISESERAVYTQMWITCPSGLCELGRKRAITYHEPNDNVTGISVRYDLTDKGIYRYIIFSRLPGDSLEMQELIVFRNLRIKKLMITSTLVKTDHTILPAPLLLYPRAEQKIGENHFLTLGWEPVTGARSYQVEVQYYLKSRKAIGDSPIILVADDWKPVLSRSVPAKTPSLSLRIDDIFHGRWRVKTIGDPGVESEVSEWRRFYYEIPRFALQVPVQVLPVNNAVFNDPRRKTGLKWTHVPKATGYGLEVQYYYGAKWVTDNKITSAKEVTATFDFPGARKGRWRVWAEWRSKYDKRSAFTSKSSPWRYFEHKK